MIRELVKRHALPIRSGAVFALALATCHLALDNQFLYDFILALVGLGTAGGLVLLWGERTRPKPNLLWLILGAILLGLAAFSFTSAAVAPGVARVLPLGILIGFFLAHDMTLSPTLMLFATVMSAVMHPEIEWNREPDDRAWWVASAVLFGVAAATLERERLQARTHPATPWPWTVLRLGLVAFWTLLVLQFRKQLQTGRFFESFGIDPGSETGRYALFGVMLVSLVIAVFLFKGKKPKPEGETPPVA